MWRPMRTYFVHWHVLCKGLPCTLLKSLYSNKTANRGLWEVRYLYCGSLHVQLHILCLSREGSSLRQLLRLFSGRDGRARGTNSRLRHQPHLVPRLVSISLSHGYYRLRHRGNCGQHFGHRKPSAWPHAVGLENAWNKLRRRRQAHSQARQSRKRSIPKPGTHPSPFCFHSHMLVTDHRCPRMLESCG
jgi:hypothetical protein